MTERTAAGKRRAEEEATVESLFEFDRDAGRRGCVVGIDEAGRGPWAGPVVAAAVSFPPEVEPLVLVGLNDSKKLSEKRRDRLAEVVLENAFCSGIGVASPREIDLLNIEKATFLAMRRALEDCGLAPDLLLVDGHRDPGLGSPTRTVVKGDGTSASIAAASILAKTNRDRYMELIAGEEDPWGFAKHKGYGVEYHRRALQVFGVSEHHRRTFKPVARILDPPNPSAAFGTLWDALIRAESHEDCLKIQDSIHAQNQFLETNEAWILTHRLKDRLKETLQSTRSGNRRKKGEIYESAVLGYFRKKGYSFVERNFHSRSGEIDLILRDGARFVFVEVKMRTSDEFGDAASAVTWKKRKRMVAAALTYLASSSAEVDCRFDVVAVDRTDRGDLRLDHYPNAFEATDFLS